MLSGQEGASALMVVLRSYVLVWGEGKRIKRLAIKPVITRHTDAGAAHHTFPAFVSL
jgi:hypothetical protein